MIKNISRINKMPKRTLKRSNRKQTGSGGCFSTVKQLEEINYSLETINKSLTNEELSKELSELEELEELEAAIRLNQLELDIEERIELEYKKITAITPSNNVNSINNNNNIIRRHNFSKEEFAALDKELAELIGQE
jgi:hypothetical protein